MIKLDQVKVLVTGGAGFIGSEIVSQLCKQKADVTILDDFSSGRMEYINRFDNVKVVKGDVCDSKIVSRAVKDQELVFHLAALPFIPNCYYHPEEFFRVNTMGTVNMMWQSVNSKTVERFVHASSSEVYGMARYVPMDEQHPTLPHSTYAVSKLAADRAVFALHKEHGFPATIARPFNSYGPKITQPYIIPEIILQLLGPNENVHLGNVETSRDFTYVEDTAQGIILAACEKKAVGETINFGSGSEIKIKNLVFLIAKVMGKRAKIVEDPTRFRPYDVERLLCDNTKAKTLLGWTPKTSLEEGLKITIDWVVNNPLKFKGPFKGWYSAYYSRGDLTIV
jgi:nucleoside-diphosphate-sugar epimerase